MPSVITSSETSITISLFTLKDNQLDGREESDGNVKEQKSPSLNCPKFTGTIFGDRRVKESEGDRRSTSALGVALAQPQGDDGGEVAKQDALWKCDSENVAVPLSQSSAFTTLIDRYEELVENFEGETYNDESESHASIVILTLLRHSPQMVSFCMKIITDLSLT